MLKELLSDIEEDISLAEQMAENVRIKKLLYNYNREAAISGQFNILKITDSGKDLKEAIEQLSPKSKLILLGQYHDTLKASQIMEQENHKTALISKVVTWVLTLFSFLILVAVALLFIGTFYEKEIPGMDFIKSTLDLLIEILKLVFAL